MNADRRNFLQVGGLGSLGLASLLQAREQAAEDGQEVKDTSVIWLWLGGGPTHVETFDPKMTAPVEYRSTTGEVATNLTGVSLGGTFPKMAQVADKMAFIRSFAHNNSGHGGGTHWLMTGYNDRNLDNGGVPSRPSMGSILSRFRGSSHAITGMPTYIRKSGIRADGPAWLGSGYAPMDERTARANLKLAIGPDRFNQRRNLLSQVDQIRRDIDASGQLTGLDQFGQQAFDLVLGSAPDAFDTSKEDPRTRDRYGKGLGEQLLQARRLCEAGCGFVTVQYGGWDMHGKIADAMKSRGPQLDHAVSALVEDLHQRGQDKNILLVVSGEFGRTPKVNKNSGRDHWSRLSTLALAGGGLQMGQVVGESANKVDVPKTTPITPQDLMATIFYFLGLPEDLYFNSNQGRPTPMISDGKPIQELV